MIIGRKLGGSDSELF